MAKKLKPDEITKWLGRIRRAEKIREEADQRYGYSRAIQEYQNDYASAMPSFLADTDIVPINEVYAYVKTFMPTVYSRDPHISVNPNGFRSILGAKILELLINSYWRELRLKREIRRAIVDAILAEGIIKVGYTGVFGNVEGEDGKPALESNEFIKNEEIFAARVSWQNIVRDPDAINGFHDARWLAERIIKPLDAVKASSLYRNTEDLQPLIIATDYDKRLKNPNYRQRDEVEYAVLWEIWDRDSGRINTISEGVDKPLAEKDWPYEMEGYPHTLLRFNENPDECYAPNLIGAWEPQLWEKIKIRAMELDHIKRFNRQIVVEEGAFTNAELQKMRLGKTAAIIKKKKGFQSPEPLTYPQVQPDVYAIENRIDLDKDNISGQPNAVRSAPQKTQSRTLGEIDRLMSSFGARQSEPQGLVEEFNEEIAMKLIKLAQQFLPPEKFVRATQTDIKEISEALTDPATGQTRFDGTGFRFTREEIQDIDFSVNVKSGSSIPLDRQNRIDTTISLLKLGPTIGIQPGGMVSRILGKTLLSEFDMKEVEQAFDDEMRQIDAQKQLVAKMQEQNLESQEQKIANMRAAGPAGMMASMPPEGSEQQGGSGAVR